MTTRDCDRACGCKAELEVANRRLSRTPNYCTAGHPAVRYEGGLDCPICGMRRTIAKMRPVYEATVRWHKAISPSDLSEAYDELYDAVATALAGDRDREVRDADHD